MARARDHVRELARRVRDELIRLGLVDDGRTVPLAEGARAGVHDLVVNRVNDHQAGLANGDVVRVEAIEDDGAGADPQGHRPRSADRGAGVRPGIGYALAGQLRLRLCPHRAHRPGRPGRGRDRGGHRQREPAVALPGDDPGHRRELRVRDDGLAAQSDPEARPAARAGAGPVRPPGPDPRGPAHRTGGRGAAGPPGGRRGARRRHRPGRHRTVGDRVPAAAAGQRRPPRPARSRCGRTRSRARGPSATGSCSPETVPEAYAAGAADSPKATWLWRSLRAAEAGGLDAREVLQTAVDSRPLAGAQDVAAVLDARIRPRVAYLTPLPEGRFSDQVPQVDDPAEQKYLAQLAAAMDGRVDRLGPFVAQQQPEWATPRSATCRRKRRPGPSGSARPGRSRSTGSGTGTTRASRSAPSRPRLPRRSAPPGTPPPQALGRPADGPDLRDRDTGCCGSCVTPTRRRRPGRPGSSAPSCGQCAPAPARPSSPAPAPRRRPVLPRPGETPRLPCGSRPRQVLGRDAGLVHPPRGRARRGRPGLPASGRTPPRPPAARPSPPTPSSGAATRAGPAALRSAEPQPVSEAERAEIDPILVRARGGRGVAGLGQGLREARPAFREQLAERQSIRIPDPDPEYADQGRPGRRWHPGSVTPSCSARPRRCPRRRAWPRSRPRGRGVRQKRRRV